MRSILVPTLFLLFSIVVLGAIYIAVDNEMQNTGQAIGDSEALIESFLTGDAVKDLENFTQEDGENQTVKTESKSSGCGCSGG